MQSSRIFDYHDYKKYFLQRIEAMPRGGRGQLQKLAAHLSVHPTLVSQVFRGPKNLTPEQACKAADYLGLTERESDYLLALVEHERAGNPPLRSYWKRRLDALREEDREVANRIAPARRISDEQRAEFYSSWEYSATRLATSIERLRTIDALAERLGLPPKRVAEIAEFLVKTGLCARKNGKLETGPSRTHLPADSPIVSRHHLNWRLKAIEAHPNLRKHELAFSAPVSIGKREREKVRAILLEAIEKVSDLVSGSDPEDVCCLNIDWFDLRGTK